MTWKDSHYRLMSTVSSEANGCPVISYRWIDQPVTYTHVYPQQLTDFQVTSLYADPGSPDDPWSPSNPFASQQNRDAFTDGSAIAGRGEWPTFGNPDRSPVVYLRVGGAFGFRLQWIGAPDDQVLRARVSFTLRNADGSTRTWMKVMNLLPATTENQGTTVDVAAGANGYPAFASEFVGGFTRIPKYATVPTMQPIQWNLTGDSASAAMLQATVYVQTDFATITWTNHHLAQAFGYPVWYFNHQID